jgi:hypothetical protein
MSSETQHLLDIADLSDADIARVLDGPDPDKLLPPTTIVGLLFLAASLRTRYGFASAAVRLGANPLSVTELRYGTEMSSARDIRRHPARCGRNVRSGRCSLRISVRPQSDSRYQPVSGDQRRRSGW